MAYTINDMQSYGSLATSPGGMHHTLGGLPGWDMTTGSTY